MKILIKIIVITHILLITNTCSGKDFQNYSVKKYSVEWAYCLQNYIQNHIFYRAVIYNALNFSQEQTQIFKNSLAQNSMFYKEKAIDIVEECKYLKILEDSNATKKEIKTQKQIIKNNIKEINKRIKTERKELKYSMTRNQRIKYKLITKLEKNDVNKECRIKNYHKSNPELLPFGAWSQRP